MERPLEGKVAIVTGAGVRVGRALAEGLGRAGASVAVHFHRSSSGAAAAVHAIRADGNLAQAYQADLTVPAELDQLVSGVERDLGPATILVNSAALFERAPFLETPLEMLDRLWNVNARGPFLLSQRVATRMTEGDIINVLDVGGALNAWRSYAAYGMTKAALSALTECLALELAPRIRVNAVAPGTVLPPDSMSEEEKERLRHRIPLQRFGSPSDVVEAVLFLLGGPRFVTGHTLVVDGGRSLDSSRS